MHMPSSRLIRVHQVRTHSSLVLHTHRDQEPSGNAQTRVPPAAAGPSLILPNTLFTPHNKHASGVKQGPFPWCIPLAPPVQATLQAHTPALPQTDSSCAGCRLMTHHPSVASPAAVWCCVLFGAMPAAHESRAPSGPPRRSQVQRRSEVQCVYICMGVKR